MRVVIMAVGSYGDVAPYTGLATALTAAGHDTVIATHAAYEPAVTAAGLPYLPLPMDPRQMLTGDHGRRAVGTSPRALRHTIAMVSEHQRDLGDAMLHAADGADWLLLSPMAWLGWHVAEGLGIRSGGVFLQPWTPTAQFPPAAMTTRSLGPWGNRAAARTLRLAGQRPARHVIDDLRTRLGLAPMSPGASFRQMDADRWPIFYGFSNTVVQAPRDWPDWHRVVGYWWPAVDQRWTPPQDLVGFLDDGPAPVYLGFGSMPADDAAGLSRTLADAVRTAGVRAVVHAGDANLHMSGDEVITIGSVPHSWLFPRVSAVVHHCGAGTTAAALRAGVPTVPVPVMVDQPFWAKRIHALGVATEPLPLARLTAASLGERLRTAVRDRAMQDSARALAAVIDGQDGYVGVVRHLEQG